MIILCVGWEDGYTKINHVDLMWQWKKTTSNKVSREKERHDIVQNTVGILQLWTCVRYIWHAYYRHTAYIQDISGYKLDICMYACIHMYVYVYAHTHLRTPTGTHTHRHKHAHTHVRARAERFIDT